MLKPHVVVYDVRILVLSSICVENIAHIKFWLCSNEVRNYDMKYLICKMLNIWSAIDLDLFKCDNLWVEHVESNSWVQCVFNDNKPPQQDKKIASFLNLIILLSEQYSTERQPTYGENASSAFWVCRSSIQSNWLYLLGWSSFFLPRTFWFLKWYFSF